MQDQQSPMYQPSEYQDRLFDGWFKKDLGHDELGQWLGWCPLHTAATDRTKPKLNATYDFRHGVFECHGDPSCVAEGKRKRVSLTNLMDLIARKVLHPQVDHGDS